MWELTSECTLYMQRNNRPAKYLHMNLTQKRMNAWFEAFGIAVDPGNWTDQ